MGWFEVDKKGLAKILSRHKNRAFLIFELVQNAWDEASKEVTIEFGLTADTQKAKLATLRVADDNPDGFKHLEHAYTLFAESDKKKNPLQRGRFNLGEKFVLACCEEASLTTTKGRIEFHNDGRRTCNPIYIGKPGSTFSGSIRMTSEEYDEICGEIQKLIPPKNIKTFFNGTRLTRNHEVKHFKAKLPTEVADENGNLRILPRETKVELHQPFDSPMLFEIGIPVTEIDLPWDVNINQKIPLSLDRTNVAPSFLKKLKVAVLNETCNLLEPDQITEPWVDEASASKDCSDKAITKVVNLRYGKKSVSNDLSDQAANRLAVSAGYTLVTGRAFNKQQWANIRRAEALKPAGQVTPSPKPYSPDGKLLNYIPQELWTPKMKEVANFAIFIARKVLFEGAISIGVDIVNEKNWPFSATFGPTGSLVLNKTRLGKNFFELYPTNIDEIVDLLIHEFGHQYESDHLSENYYRALTKIGGKMFKLALDDPKLLEGIKDA